MKVHLLPYWWHFWGRDPWQQHMKHKQTVSVIVWQQGMKLEVRLSVSLIKILLDQTYSVLCVYTVFLFSAARPWRILLHDFITHCQHLSSVSPMLPVPFFTRSPCLLPRLQMLQTLSWIYIYLLYEVKRKELASNTEDVAKKWPSNSSQTPQLSTPIFPRMFCSPPPAEIFREVWDYFHKENLNPLTSCPAMRSLVSEGVSVKCLLLKNSPGQGQRRAGAGAE